MKSDLVGSGMVPEAGSARNEPVEKKLELPAAASIALAALFLLWPIPVLAADSAPRHSVSTVSEPKSGTAQDEDLSALPEPFEAEVGGNSLWGFRHKDGTPVVIDPRYLLAMPFTDGGIAAVADKSGWWIIDLRGKPLLRPFIYDSGPDDFSEGLARFVDDAGFGYFDHTGRKVIAAQFDAAEPFSEGLAAVCRGCRQEKSGEHSFWTGGRWGYADAEGTLVVPYRYDAAGPFHLGRAEVLLNGHKLVIDVNGE